MFGGFMSYDNRHNDVREFIHWDYSSKYASPQQQIVYKDKEKEALLKRHEKPEGVDIWKNII